MPSKPNTQHSSYESGSHAGRAGDFNLLGPAVSVEVVDLSKGDCVIQTSLGAKGLYVGKTGNVSISMVDGIDVVFERVQAGTILPIQFQLVYADGTTASALVALI